METSKAVTPPAPTTGATTTTTTTTKITFGFSKKLAQPKVVENSAISDPSALQEKEETDFVSEVNEAEGVKGTLVREEKRKGPLVIPCLAVNDWAAVKGGKDGGKDGGRRKHEDRPEEEEEEAGGKRRKLEGKEEENESTTVKEEKSAENIENGGTRKETIESTAEDKAVQELIEEAK